MGDQSNPFALVKASDYTDAQINSLWVDLGPKIISALIEPRSALSKYILGGKGSGKTHILRYNSYQVARLRSPSETGFEVVARTNFLAVFLRAAALDSARFEFSVDSSSKWQQVFSVYLELRLTEVLLEALCDIKRTSPAAVFNDAEFLSVIADAILDASVRKCRSIEEFSIWITEERRRIDDAVNNAAFTGNLSIRIPFSIGSLCFNLRRAQQGWNDAFRDIPLIYMLDEIENLSEDQQQVVNSLVRYSEGRASFRITGRLYSRKTLATIGSGEENREGSEFTTVNLDSILKDNQRYADFAKKFVLKRLGYTGAKTGNASRDPSLYFEGVRTDKYYEDACARLGIKGIDDDYRKRFCEALRLGLIQSGKPDRSLEVYATLTEEVLPIIARLNVLQFCKGYSRRADVNALAEHIRLEGLAFLAGEQKTRSYADAYGHFRGDLFAQMCRESKLGGVPYAGFENFVSMSSGNPRNLLVILGRAYEIAAFREIDFINGAPLSIELQTEAAVEAARFMYERDTNYGSLSDIARSVAGRLATVLRTARYALNIPEVSPLVVSFSDADLQPSSRRALDAALNYSFLFEVRHGRPDRNSDRVMRKIQLNPLLSPRWGLPIGRRGDIGLNAGFANAIFDSDQKSEFDVLLKNVYRRWNGPFVTGSVDEVQLGLFE